MNEDLILSVAQEGIRTAMYIAAPMLIAAMLVGIVISILQAVTQINEATLTFIPKIFAVVIVLVVMAPWMLRIIQDYTIMVLGNVGEWIR